MFFVRETQSKKYCCVFFCWRARAAAAAAAHAAATDDIMKLLAVSLSLALALKKHITFSLGRLDTASGRPGAVRSAHTHKHTHFQCALSRCLRHNLIITFFSARHPERERAFVTHARAHTHTPNTRLLLHVKVAIVRAGAEKLYYLHNFTAPRF